MIARLKCWLLGHKRGRRDNAARPVNAGEQAYRCPRCKATWVRKVKAV